MSIEIVPKPLPGAILVRSHVLCTESMADMVSAIAWLQLQVADLRQELERKA